MAALVQSLLGLNPFTSTNAAPQSAGPTLRISDVSANEGNSGTTDVLVVVTLSNPNGQTVTVDYQVANGTAVRGSDYTVISTSGTMTFFNGSAPTQRIRVSIDGDAVNEPNETFFINLSNATNAALADNQAVGTIINDDGGTSPALTIADVSTSEGNTGATDVLVAVTLTNPNGQTVTVDYQVANGTATRGSDYTVLSASGTITFFNGGATTQRIRVTINGDATNEPNETFFVNLNNVTNATLADGQAVGTIINDDGGPSPALSISDVSMNEGNSGTTDVLVAVTLTNPNGQTVTVDYQVVNGTAVRGSDYTVLSTSGTITFLNGGATTQRIRVTINGDATNEPDETFGVNLSNATNAKLADDQAVGTIINDDALTPPAAPSNLALNKPIAASSATATRPVMNAIDGSTNTYWRSGSVSNASPPTWLRVDLGAPVAIGKVVVKWRDVYFAKNYEAQVSNDNVNWTTVSSALGAEGAQTLNFSSRTARYVRLYLTLNMTSHYRVEEFEVYSGTITKPHEFAAAAASLPDEFVLEQNYPNPFSANGTFSNPSTQIRFALPQDSHVTIKVYTLNGAAVRTLADDRYTAGTHAVVFRPKNLPSGTYFYVMQAGSVRLVRQLMLVK